MSGNGGDNAHNNAFGGGGRGPTGGVNGTSGKGGPTGNGPDGRLPSGGINGSGNGANVGHGGSMTVDLGNGVTATFEGVHALEPGKDSGVPWGGNNGNGGNNNGGGNGSSDTGTAPTPGPSPLQISQQALNLAVDNFNKAQAEVTKNQKRLNEATVALQRAEKELDLFYELEIFDPTDPVWYRTQENQKKRDVERKKSDKSAAQNALNTANQILNRDAEKKKQAEEEQSLVVDSVKLVSDFYGDVTEKLGAKNASLAKELAESAKGKKLRNVNEALAAFEKHKSAINSKFSVQDREAIAKAIESVNKDALAKNLQKFSKAFGITSQVIDYSQLANAIAKGIRTGEWKDAMLKIESMAVGKAASMAVAFTFSFLTVTPLGIAVFALLMTVTGALINERMMEKMNKQLFNI
ncbi:hypothetical protein FOC46_03235 [Citrobacter portucalensis]|uniref:colicin-like pore-forming protein n=1 Tax=Citrobacter portucalensis TaxID=1639133 RepID=UPI0002412955|nr:colicin-like pore-forming protein [Citrobacter portucalensis]EHL81924.1 hypothetical protein HMPREF9428_00923 [Citrobacter portucalensis]QGS12566.1 hypothetical protein FOC46_03235 [Citrobacter portucalensis]